MAIDNIPMFTAMNSEEVKPPFPKPPFAPPKRPLTSQESLFAIMERVNACVQTVNDFIQHINHELDCFIDKTDTNYRAFTEAIQESYNAFQQLVQTEVNNFESDIQAQMNAFRTDVDLRIANFEDAINRGYDEFISEVRDLNEKMANDIQTFKTKMNNDFALHKAEVISIVDSFKAHVDSELDAQDRKIEEYKDHMVDHIEDTTRDIFEEKVDNGAIAAIMKSVFGETMNFKGSKNTYEEITAVTGASNGDYYYNKADDHYYMYASGAWVDIGTAQRLADEFEDFKIAVSNEHINARSTRYGVPFERLGDAYKDDDFALYTTIYHLLRNGGLYFEQNISWEIGGIDGADGTETTANRLRSKGYIRPYGTIKFEITDPFAVLIFTYNINALGEYVYTSSNVFTAEKANNYLLLAGGRTNLAYRFVIYDQETDTITDTTPVTTFKVRMKYDLDKHYYALAKDVEDTTTILNEMIVEGYKPFISEWGVGGIDGANGVITSAVDRIYTFDYFEPVSNIIHYEVENGYRLLLYEFTSDGDYNSNTYGWYTGTGNATINSKMKYKAVLRAIEDREFTGEEFINVKISSPLPFVVERAADTTVTAEDDIPEYWKEEIERIADEINAKSNEAAAQGYTPAKFFFIGDTHYPNNTGVSAKLMKYLAEKCSIRTGIHVGDIMEDSTVSYKAGLERLTDGMELLKSVGVTMLTTPGNHDDNAGIKDGNGQIKADRIIYKRKLLETIMGHIPFVDNYTNVYDTGHYWFDDPINKIRFISLDAFATIAYNIDGDLLTSTDFGSMRTNNWSTLFDYAQAAANAPDGYAIVTFSHMQIAKLAEPGGGENDDTFYGDIPEAGINEADGIEITRNILVNAYTNGHPYLGHFSGHVHYDFNGYREIHDFTDSIDNGYFPQITILNDGLHRREGDYFSSGDVPDAPLKTPGTITECAFDVVLAYVGGKSTDNHIYLYRVGAGSNVSKVRHNTFLNASNAEN